MVNSDTPVSFFQLQYAVRRLSPLDLLRLFSPDKTARVSEAVSEISALAEYELSLCNHLAASEPLEPMHAVLVKLLRSGADFKTTLTNHPIQLETQRFSRCAAAPM